MLTHILIQDGDIFDGNLDQFEDCFFCYATAHDICQWAECHNFSVELHYEVE